MSRLEKHTVQALKAVEHNEPIPAAVFLPPALRGKKSIVYAFTSELPNVKENMVRISNEADPIGMLIAVALGQPIATHTVKKDGTIETKYESLPLKSPVRERAMRFLAERILPRMSVKMSQQQDNAPSPNDNEWEAIFGSAAERADDEGK